jgi:hypothetical protein
MRFVKSVTNCKTVMATYTGKYSKRGKTFETLLKEHVKSYAGPDPSWNTKVKFLALSAAYLEGRNLCAGRLTQTKSGTVTPVNRVVFKNATYLAEVCRDTSVPFEVKFELLKHLSCLYVASHAQSNYLTHLGNWRDVEEKDFSEMGLFINPSSIRKDSRDRSWRRRDAPDLMSYGLFKGSFAYPLDGLFNLAYLAAPVFQHFSKPLGSLIRELLLTPWIQDQNSLWTVEVSNYIDCVDINSWDNLQREEFIKGLISYSDTVSLPNTYGFLGNGYINANDYNDVVSDFVYSLADSHNIDVNAVEISRMFGEYLTDEGAWKESVWFGIRDPDLSSAVNKLTKNPDLITLGQPKNCLRALLGKEDLELKVDVLKSISSLIEEDIKNHRIPSLDIKKLAELAAKSNEFHEYYLMSGAHDSYSYRRYHRQASDHGNIEEWQVALATSADPRSAFLRAKELLSFYLEKAEEKLEKLIKENEDWLPKTTAFFFKLGIHTDTSETKRLFCSDSCKHRCEGKKHTEPRISLETQELTPEEVSWYTAVKITDALVSKMKDHLIRKTFVEISKFSDSEIAEIEAVDIGDLF